MKKDLRTSECILALSLVVIAMSSRLFDLPANVNPMTACALLAGAILPRPLAFIVPLGALFLSDLIIGFHSTMFFVYGAFLLATFLGSQLKPEAISRPSTYLPRAIIASFVFYVVTNAGVFLVDSLYPRTLAGLVECYVQAIPFFGRSLLSDLLFTFVVFSVFAQAHKRIPLRA